MESNQKLKCKEQNYNAKFKTTYELGELRMFLGISGKKEAVFRKCAGGRSGRPKDAPGMVSGKW
ncbi:MAG: hypothetical protein ACYS83_09945 [Planctomycetota bacterium]